MKIMVVSDEPLLEMFMGFPESVYKNDDVWCKENGDRIIGMKAYSESRGGFFQLYLVLDEGEVLARASGSLDPKAVIDGKMIGSLGHFEALKGQELAVSILFSTIENDLRREGASTIIAPRNDIMTLGLQISGFGLPQTWGTPHNPDYYRDYFEKNGYSKKEDLITFIMEDDTPMESFDDIGDIRIRSIRKKEPESEIKIFNRLNNAIFSSHENFIPRTIEEDKMIIGSMLPLLDEDLVLFAEEENGTPVGLLVSIPDHNQRLKEEKITRARLITIGVLPGHTRKGIGKMMGKRLKENLLKKGYRELEGSWVLESNLAPMKGAESIGASVGRIFRLYSKDLD